MDKTVENGTEISATRDSRLRVIFSSFSTRYNRVKFSQLPFIETNDKGNSARAVFYRSRQHEHLVAPQRTLTRIPNCDRVTQSHPYHTRITLHHHGPSKWTSFGTSSSNQLDLFCFLNTHRWSG
ncbi:hypothetical protein P5V15_001684 [Pogonomyrmex californicus]